MKSNLIPFRMVESEKLDEPKQLGRTGHRHTRTGAADYLENEQEWLGSFFVDLNELTRTFNRKIRHKGGEGALSRVAAEDEADEALFVHDGYYTMYDVKRGRITFDRLALKLMLFRKEGAEHLSDLEVLYHNLAPLEESIRQQLDPYLKGTADLEDLAKIVAENLRGNQRRLMEQNMRYLEYKNADKVFYSPLFLRPGPFFRFAKRFDSLALVQRIDKELRAVDHYDNGLVNSNMFRAVLEGELKLKEKIITDFCDKLTINFLDFNGTSHSIHAQVDSFLLIRKLIDYLDVAGVLEKERELQA